MLAPEFWEHGKGGILSAALSPLGWAYGFGGRVRRAAARPWRAPVPVLSVGNAVAGGAGKTRGGLGIRRRYEILEDGVEYAQYGDRFKFRPEGLFGGEAGAPASCTITRDGETTALKSKNSAELRKGDILTVSTGGGAGYGPPSERSPDTVRADIYEGFVTRRAADESYGTGEN